MSKSVSKKQIAQEFFRSLDQGLPWKLRLSQTIDHMKEKFPRGQTERVVYQHVRDLISEQDRPNPSAQSVRDAISAKIDELRRHKNERAASQPRLYRNHSLVQKLLMCGDLYSPRDDYNNKNRIYKKSDAFSVEFYPRSYDIRIDSAVMIDDRLDFSSSVKLQFSEIFPYFDKEFLETPISLKELVGLSGDLLSQSEMAVLEEAFLHGETFPKAIEWLSGEIARNVEEEIQQDLQSSKIFYEEKSRKIPDVVLKYSVAVFLSLAIFSCIKLNEGRDSRSTEDEYIERCMENGTPQSVCGDWYEEIEQSIDEHR